MRRRVLEYLSQPKNIVPVLAAVALIGAAVYSLVTPPPETPALDQVVGVSSSIEGIVTADPDVREKFIYLTLSVEAIGGKPAEGRILASVDQFSEAAYGDRVIVEGALKTPEQFETDTDRTFDYPKYLLAHGITHTMSFAKLSVMSSGEGNPVVAALLSVKHWFVSGIEKALPEPESALLAGLLIGEKQSLGEKITEAFRAAGVIHIIVLSGYNFSIIIKWFMRVFGFLSRGWLVSSTILAIFAFLIMTGVSETALRAALMASIVLFAQFLNRPTEGLRILLVAAAGMAVVNPYVVLYDLSYQLSIIATLGLILFSNALASRMLFIPESFGLREVVATTIGTQITVLPLLVFSVGQVSIVSLLANVAILPAVPAAMLLGFISSCLALIGGWLSFIPSLFAYGILHYIISVAEFFGSIPFGAFVVPADFVWPSLAALGVAYAAVFVFHFLKQKRGV